jgi:hypothetical protein
MALASVALAAAASQAAWKQVLSTAPWSARSDPQLVVLGGRMILLGGHANSDYYNDVWASADGGHSWSQQPTPPWSNRSYHTAKAFGGRLYMIGGHDGTTWYNGGAT